MAPHMAHHLTTYLRQFHHHTNVSGIQVSADDTQDTPLAWAEVIPLVFINETSFHNTDTPTIQHIFWSQPLRRFDKPWYGTNMVTELLQLGQQLFTWMEEETTVEKEDKDKRIAVVVSADLAHTHRHDGPYGYSPAAQPFDHAIQQWLQYNPCSNAHQLLQIATTLQPQALSCGYTGLVLFHGMLCGGDDTTTTTTTTAGGGTSSSNAGTTSSSNRRTTSSSSSSSAVPPLWKSHVVAMENVTYYGMIAAGIQRNDESMYS
jgi:aromatic ring-opening dioxygenase LigB subunit